MVKRVKFRASVGRQNITRVTPSNQTAYIRSIRQQMKQITSNYETLLEELGAQGAEVLLDALRPTFELSQKYVPVDSGDLKESGFLEKDPASKVARVVLGYAKNGKPDYAVFVHEILSLEHTPPTKAKFLLTALEEDANNIQKRIVKGYQQIAGVRA